MVNKTNDYLLIYLGENLCHLGPTHYPGQAHPYIHPSKVAPSKAAPTSLEEHPAPPHLHITG